MLALVFTAALVAAQQTPAKPDLSPNEVSPVVVTAARDPQAALRRLEACVERKCPPAEDMRLTLRSAEESFLAGEYKQARASLDASIRRNKRHGRNHPVLMAGVYKADNTINRHLGRGYEAHRSARQAYLLLEHRYGDDSGEALWARLDAADALLNIRRLDDARGRYQEIEDAAQKRGLKTLQGVAAMRQAWLPALRGRSDTARKKLQRVIDEAGPDQSGLVLAAEMLQVKLLPEKEQDAAAGRAINRFRSRWAGAPEPVLLWAPLLDQRQEIAMVQTLALARIQQPSMPDPSDWIDVGYSIGADGRVVEAEILRAGSTRASWHKTALDLMKRRIYAQARTEAGGRTYRVERLAFTALLLTPGTGTRIPTRSLVNQLHATDLSRAKVAAPAAEKP